MKTFILLFALLILISTKVNAQTKNAVGLALLAENLDEIHERYIGAPKISHQQWLFSGGLSYERVLGNHISAVISFNYRKALNDIYIPIPAGGNFTDYAHFFVAEQFLSIPLLFKYRSSIINFSVGPSVDYFLSWSEEKRYYMAPLQQYDGFMKQKIAYGFYTSLSKTIPLDHHLSLEPLAYFNQIHSYPRIYFGGGVALKYGF